MELSFFRAATFLREEFSELQRKQEKKREPFSVENLFWLMHRIFKDEHPDAYKETDQAGNIITIYKKKKGVRRRSEYAMVTDTNNYIGVHVNQPWFTNETESYYLTITLEIDLDDFPDTVELRSFFGRIDNTKKNSYERCGWVRHTSIARQLDGTASYFTPRDYTGMVRELDREMAVDAATMRIGLIRAYHIAFNQLVRIDGPISLSELNNDEILDPKKSPGFK